MLFDLFVQHAAFAYCGVQIIPHPVQKITMEDFYYA